MASTGAREAYNARLLAELKADPSHPKHGSTTAYRAGCRCVGRGSCTQANSHDQLQRRYDREHVERTRSP